MCCVEACLIDCYLSDSGLYVYKSCCLGVQRHLPTYESCSRFQDGHETNDETNAVSDLRDSMRMSKVVVEERGGLGYADSVSYDAPSCGRGPIRNCIGRDSAFGGVGDEDVD
jgi:hypothetical protein